MACYKKLLNIQPTLSDLKELNPSVGQGVQYILDTLDPDLEEKLFQPFTVVLDVFGSTVVHELLEEGAETYVNQDNKDMYAMLLVDFWFN